LSPLRQAIVVEGINVIDSQPPEDHLGAEAHLRYNYIELGKPMRDHLDEDRAERCRHL
jgi:hypothetical protein